MGLDGKYGRVTVEHVRERPIGEDEPVFLFRAQDELLLKVLIHYHDLCKQAGSPPDHLNGIVTEIMRIKAWQDTNYTRTPGKTA
jgi:hypothetical protein